MTSLADANSRHAALALGISLTGDALLYLLLPMYAAQFGVTLAEIGVLLAANRLIRLLGYGWVVHFYATHGARLTCSLAVLFAAICALGYALCTGFWVLLGLRLVWGMAFAALNLSTQVLATAQAEGAHRRSGLARKYIAWGPVLALPSGALLCYSGVQPQWVFGLLALVILSGLWMTGRLPTQPQQLASRRRRLTRPNPLDIWSFLEGLILDGLFIVGLTYLGNVALPGQAVVVTGLLLALRYLGEILLSPLGGRLAGEYGAERLLVLLSLLTSLALIGFGAGWLWSCATLILVLRSLQLPLLAPLVAQRTPGPERVRALASRETWRDLGAGTGPVLAGLLLPELNPLLVYGLPALALAAAAIACVAERPVDEAVSEP